MKNYKIALSILSLCIISHCKQNAGKSAVSRKVDRNYKDKNPELLAIRDTTLFINSSEGEDVKLLFNIKSKDSVIYSVVYGEMGKSTYEFVFNKILKQASCVTYRYEEPISVNADPTVYSEKKEDLATSAESSKRLTALFQSYHKIFNAALEPKSKMQVDSNWNGKYTLMLNSNDDDWRNIKEINLTITSDSVTYLAKGYQLYQYFNLSAEEKDGYLFLNYQNAMDNTDSWALEKTVDFGTLTSKKVGYTWSSPYLNTYFNDGKKVDYLINKAK